MPGRNILIVEDDPIIGMLLVDVLIGMGHGVCALDTNAADAVANAASLRPDFLLVDVTLGASSGIDAVTEIRRTQPIPYLYMTGAVITVGTPNDVVLYKPFIQSDLAKAIERALT